MADTLRIEIDVNAARQSLQGLTAAFQSFQSAAATSVGQASAAVTRLNQAMSQIKAINPNVLNSLSQLNQAIANINSGALNGAQAALERLGASSQAINNAAQATQALGSALQQVSTPAGVERISVSFGRAGAAAQQADAHMRAFAQNQRTVQMAVGNLGRELLNAAGYMSGLGVTAGNIIQSLGTLASTGISVTATFAAMQQQFGTWGTVAAGIAGVAVAVTTLYNAVSNLVTPVYNVSAAFQAFELAIDAIDGSGAGAETLQKVQGIAVRTGQDVLTLTKTYTGFRAASEAFGMSADDSLKTFENFSGALRALGADSQKTEKAFLAITQSFSKGKVQMEELRGQLGDALPGAFTYTAQAMNMTTGELEKMIRAGEATPKVLVQLGEFLNVKFGDAIAQQVQSAVGQLNLFQSTWQNLLQLMGRGGAGGIMGGLASGFRSLNEALDSETIRSFAVALGNLIGLLTSGVLGAVGGFVQGLTAVADAALNAIRYISDVTGLTAALSAVFSNGNNTMNAVAGTFELLGRAVGALTAVYIANRAAALAGAAATLIFGRANVTAALQAGSLGNAVKILTTALARNPFTAILTGLVTFGPMVYDAIKSLDLFGNSAEAAGGKAEKFASDTNSVANAMENFNSNLAKAPESLITAAAGFESLEAAQKDAKIQINELEKAIESNNNALSRTKFANAEAKASHEQNIRSLEGGARAYQAEKSAIQDSISVKKENARIAKQVNGLNAATGTTFQKGIDLSHRQTQALREVNGALRDQRGAIAESKAAFDAKQASEKSWSRDMEQVNVSLKQQIAGLKEWGVALNANGQFLAKSLFDMGKSKEEAAGLAYAIQQLTRSESERASALQNSVEQKLENIKLLQRERETLVKARDAELEKQRSAGASQATLDATAAAYNRTISQIDAFAGSMTESAAAESTLLNWRHKGMSLTEAADATNKKFNSTLNTQVDTSQALGGALGLLNPEQQKQADSSKAATDSTKALGDQSKKTAEETTKAADAAQKAGENIANVSTAITNSASVMESANSTLGQTTTIFTGLGTQMTSLTNTIPTVNAAFGAMVTSIASMREPLAPVVTQFQLLSEKTAQLATEMPTIAGAFTGISTAALQGSAAVTSFAQSFTQLGTSAAGIDAATTAVQTLVNQLNNSLAALNNSAAALRTLASAGNSVGTGYENALKKGSVFLKQLVEMKANVEGLIGVMRDLKAAAEDAFDAIRATQNANSTSTSETPGGREGGRATELIGRHSVPTSAFDNAPKFAEGTSNTSKHISKVPGGGIPSILHPNEAVVPLSKGRSIPVDLTMPKMTTPTTLPGVEDVSYSLDNVAQGLRSVASAISNQKLQPVMSPIASMPELGYEIPDMSQSPNARVAERVPVLQPSPDGLSSGGVPQSRNRNSERSATTPGQTNNINIYVTTEDADSFKRSEDQIARRLSDRIRRANRRAGT